MRWTPMFASTSSVTVPVPVPVAPLATPTHGSLLTAVHEHHPAVETVTVRLAAPAAIDCEAGEMEYEHGGGGGGGGGVTGTPFTATCAKVTSAAASVV